MSAPEKFGGLVFGVDHGEEVSRGSFQCVGYVADGKMACTRNSQIRGLTHHQSPPQAASSSKTPNSSGGKERRKEGSGADMLPNSKSP